MKHTLPREDVRRLAGQLIMCGFDGTEVTPELKEVIKETQPSGVILFARNIESPEQVRELNRELKALRPENPLMVAVDQEGGRVARVREPATTWPPMRTLGQIGDDRLVFEVARALGRELRAMGFDVDFAPVLDVDTNPNNPVIGDRSFARDPHLVARLGAATVKGLHAAGVAACGKHFPGHGDTDLDSHLALPKVGHDLDRLRAVEWPPFTAAIKAGVGAIMTAHVVVESIDPQHPGTLSPRVMGYLREELGFQGVIVSDDVEMKAVADSYAQEEIARRGLAAGVDLFLACHLPEIVLDLYRGVVRTIEEGELDHEELKKRAGRIQSWHRRFYAPVPEPQALTRWLGCHEHAELKAAIEQRQGLLA